MASGDATRYGEFMVADRCALGGRFRRCSRPPRDTCQYCARPVCTEHAYVLEGYDVVCSRSPCVAKHDDIPGHHEYVRGVRLRNRDGACGFEACEFAASFDCSKCLGRFCLGHLTDQLYPSVGSRDPAEMAVVCDHCWQRRNIWSKP